MIHINLYYIFYWSQTSIMCIGFHDRLTRNLEIKEIVKNVKGEYPRKNEKIKKGLKKHNFEIFTYSRQYKNFSLLC